MYSHLLTSLMQRLNWIIHVILAVSFLAQGEQTHVTVVWWYVLNDSLVGYFPRENHDELLPSDKPCPVCRREAAPAADEMSKETLQPPGYTERHGIRWDASRSA